MNRFTKKIFVLFAISAFVYALLSCEKTAKMNQVETKQNMVQLIFFDSLDVKNLEIIAEVVDDEYHRAKGLMFRESLPENQGMFFIFDDDAPRYFWMKNTTISLDIIYVMEGCYTGATFQCLFGVNIGEKLVITKSK